MENGEDIAKETVMMTVLIAMFVLVGSLQERNKLMVILIPVNLCRVRCHVVTAGSFVNNPSSSSVGRRVPDTVVQPPATAPQGRERDPLSQAQPVRRAVLPAGTKLGHVWRTGTPSTVTGADPVPPPFAYSNLGDILAYYSITPGSEQARQVASTLRFCGRSEARGGDQPEKPHVCANTEQVAMEFAAAALGAATAEPLRTVVHGREEPHRYTVAPGGITSITGTVVPCHPLPYPADVLYCHRPGNVGAVRVELVGQDDPSLGATAIAVCHEDTSGWDAEYFATLNGSRGEPICHYMPDKYVVWVTGEIH
ncbi:BURP domain-containing protein 4 [Triticum aestivum]|uniref:BURP domain-containing protein 4 n=1 Tax=Triticum aestivum TaxID=4565 RepID=UPI001D0233DF|nr:BURP domain-containing protein 4-like [Triticum aestivum]